MRSISLSPDLTDFLLNNAVSAALLTSLAVLTVQLIPARLPRLRANVVIGVFAALLALPALRWALPHDAGMVFALQPAALRHAAQGQPQGRFTGAPIVPIATEPNLLTMPATIPAEAPVAASVYREPSLPEPLAEAGLKIDWPWVAALFWGLGVCISIFRLLTDWFRLRRLGRALPHVVDPALKTLWQKVAGERAESVKLVVAPRGGGLFAFGWRQPCVAIPAGLLSAASEKEALALLAHEWAHIENRDALLGHLQRAVAAVYWWLPSVHWLNKRLSLSRETLADTAAAARVDSPVLYAHSLLNLAAQACRKQQTAVGAIGIAGSRSALAQRLTTLSKHYEHMKSTLHNPHPFRAPLAVLSLCSLCLAFELTYAQSAASSASAATPAAPSADAAPSPLPAVPPAAGTPLDLPTQGTPVLPPGDPATRIAESAEPADVLTRPGELEALNAGMQRALVDMRRQLAETQKELQKLKSELVNALAERDANQSRFKYEPGKVENKEQAAALEFARQAEVMKVQQEEMHRQMAKARAEIDGVVRQSLLPALEETALRDQQRALQETITQAVAEALRAAAAELRKEFEQRNAPDSSPPRIEN